MGGRAWMVILGMGVASVVILGFLTKFAIESSPDLQSIIRFKAAFAKEFEDEGIREVSVRKNSGRRGHQLVLTLPAPPQGAVPARLEDEFAEYFVKNFEPATGALLEISYQSPGSPGCSAGTVYKTSDVPLAPVRLRVADKDRMARLEARLKQGLSCRLLAWAREGRELRVDLEEESAGPQEGADLARALEKLIREEFRAQPYHVLRLRVRRFTPPSASNAGETPPFVEAHFDGAGKELKG